MKINKYLEFKNDNPLVMIKPEQEYMLRRLVAQCPNQTELLEWVSKAYDTNNTGRVPDIGPLKQLSKQQLTEVIVTRQYTVVDTMDDRLAYYDQHIRNELQRCDPEADPLERSRLEGQLELLDGVKTEYRRYLSSTGKIDDWFDVHVAGGKIVLSPTLSFIKVEVDEEGTITATDTSTDPLPEKD
ncbi:hypothetical protein Goe27_02040 [Bacillus phage vB_BsuM-Goe27]|nr:hypothetical protein Goe24_01990 [Bacillus phage vB_BsuM-Goe24]WCS70082.1 hypothetical protein Goe27_02040 [Bacillus phage vB_BsuM-Goe27]